MTDTSFNEFNVILCRNVLIYFDKTLQDRVHRLFAESLENATPAPEAALRELGAGAVARFAYGTLPLIAPQCLGYVLYRWEMNIRMATILGFVGAGGLGQMLYFHLSLFQQPQAATVLIAMTLLVLADDALSGRARRALSAQTH